MEMKDLQNDDQSPCDYYIAFVCLHVAYTTSIHSLSEDQLDVLFVLFDPLIAEAVHTATSSSEYRPFLSIRKAIKLARLSNVRSNALDMLHNEMSKAYLHQSLAYGQESTYCVVHVLLAALYYKSGHYHADSD